MMGFHACDIGEVHSQGSWSGVQHKSGRLPTFFSSGDLVLFPGLVLLPIDVVVGGVDMHMQLFHSSHLPSSLLACAQLF